MSAETLAEWLRRRGHRIVRGAGSLWYDAGARVFQPVPFHQVFTPPEDELRAMIREERALGVRYSAPPAASEGLVSYHVVFDVAEHGPYGFAQIGSRTRNKVRRGLRETWVGEISCDRLAREGWRLQQDTLARQGRLASMDEASWVELCRAAEGLPGFEAWGAYVNRTELAATMLVARVDDTYAVLTAQSHRDYFEQYINNALCFTVSSDLLTRPGVRAVFYSTHSLDAPPSVDEFKFLMGYKARPVRQRVIFHPLAAPLINPASHALASRLLKAGVSHPTLSKAEGLMRFYLEGRRPATRQRPPAAIRQELTDEASV